MRTILLATLGMLASIPLFGQLKTEGELKDELMQAHTKGQTQFALLELDELYRRERRWIDDADTLKNLVQFWAANFPPDSVGFARYSTELGKALERGGDPVAAEPYFRSAIQIYEKHGSVYDFAKHTTERNLSEALRREGKLAQADELSASLPAGKPKAIKPDRGPEVISKEEPQYTNEARRHQVNGTVGLSVTIDESGVVQAIEISKPLGFGLDESAVKTVRKWKFKPATANGSAVNTEAQIEVSFRLL